MIHTDKNQTHKNKKQFISFDF